MRASGNLLRRSGNADQAGVEEGDVFRQALRRIALGSAGDEYPLHLCSAAASSPDSPWAISASDIGQTSGQ
ncbi:MAG: hypothetical protein IPP85_15020 [Propionivibrio sp.]|nr:hypothetical protein [Propionivibrio sp.]